MHTGLNINDKKHVFHKKTQSKVILNDMQEYTDKVIKYSDIKPIKLSKYASLKIYTSMVIQIFRLHVTNTHDICNFFKCCCNNARSDGFIVLHHFMHNKCDQ